jgi:hypothetical protein
MKKTQKISNAAIDPNDAFYSSIVGIVKEEVAAWNRRAQSEPNPKIAPPDFKSVLDDRIDRLNAATLRLGEITANFHAVADKTFGIVGAEGKASTAVPQPSDAISRLIAAQGELDAMIDVLANAYGRLHHL